MEVTGPKGGVGSPCPEGDGWGSLYLGRIGGSLHPEWREVGGSLYPEGEGWGHCTLGSLHQGGGVAAPRGGRDSLCPPAAPPAHSPQVGAAEMTPPEPEEPAASRQCKPVTSSTVRGGGLRQKGVWPLPAFT